MERNEFQTRTKLEAQIASTERELALAKKKLEHEEEERDKRREAWEQRVTSQYCRAHAYVHMCHACTRVHTHARRDTNVVMAHQDFLIVQPLFECTIREC